MKKILNIILIIIALFLTLFGVLSSFITDFLWFDSLKFSSLFLTILKSKIGLFFISALFFLTFYIINTLIARKFIKKSRFPYLLVLAVGVLISFFVGFISSKYWFTVLQYLNRTMFNVVDPILGKDVAFYVFSLPFLNFLWSLSFSIVLITTLFIIIYYFQKKIIDFILNQTLGNQGIIKSENLFKSIFKLSNPIKNHLTILFSFIFILVAVKYYLARFSVMFSKEGIVVGAGYVDVNIFLPVVEIMMFISFIFAIIFLVYNFFFSNKKKIKRRHIILSLFGVYLLVAFIGQLLAPGLVQSFVVDPNEFNLEKPFIENNIEFTRKAYGLDSIEEYDFDANYNISRQTIENNPETIDSIRILDYRAVTQTYKQTQEMRLYYDLSYLDIDRYTINNKTRQVLLAPRELNQNKIVDNAKTWVNLHLIYTHGFGVVMSPVNKVTREGLPDYLIKDIPPISSNNDETLMIDEPRIYYGNLENNYVLVNTKTPEFDYPKDNDNEYIHYDGKGGVLLNSFIRKVLFSLRFNDIKLLLTKDITNDSKIMYHRNIQRRVNKVAPFLRLDEDPYLIISEGKLYWIQDAYTTTNSYPYSEKYFNGFNYIRNSVKVVVDAYDGDMKFFIVEEEPIVKTYEKIFPDLFNSFNEMPNSIKEHLRYPENLFDVQSKIFSTYHMENVNVFYNKEDAWEIPKEIYGGRQVLMEPYYTLMKLPNENVSEFILMLPFTPLRKNNMISWLAGRSDKDNYGKLILYRFPKDKLVYGPSQIEARIDQDSDISEQLTLWNQQGSSVIRGNLLVIPIENNILYVEPLYIRSDQGQLPELKRVIVSDGNKIVMENTLKDSLRALFGEKQEEEVVIVDDGVVSTIDDVNSYYEKILEAMQENDWQSFGENFDKLGDAIKDLK